jgi:hypothetical protein
LSPPQFGDDFPNYCLCDGIVAPKVRPAWLDKFCMCDCKTCPATCPHDEPTCGGLRHHYRMTEQAIKDMADVMVSSGMAKAGYEYINLDDVRCPDAAHPPTLPSLTPVRSTLSQCWQSWNRSSTGELIANSTNFPSGMPALVDYIHGKGLKSVPPSTVPHTQRAVYPDTDLTGGTVMCS